MNGCPRLAWLWLPRENINGNNSQIALRYNGKIPTRIAFRSWRQACKKYSSTVGHSSLFQYVQALFVSYQSVIQDQSSFESIFCSCGGIWKLIHFF